MNMRRATAQPPLRIAMVAACAFPSLRGSQVLIRDLAQSLAGRGHEVHLITYPYGDSLAAVDGIRLHRARVPWVGENGKRWAWYRLVLDVCLAVTLYRVVRQAHIQVIHAHNYEAPLASFLVRWITRVPIVYHSHNALSDELAYYFTPGWRQRIAQFVGGILDHQVPRRADFAIALTPELERFLRLCGATNVATIPPTGAGPPAAGGHYRSGRFHGRFVVMYTGNLDPYQDLEVLWVGFATVLARVPEALLVLVTHETNWEERAGARLLELVNRGAAQVIVASTFSAVRRWMACADVLVCPRQSWSGFPIKLLNYLASGRPVVAAVGCAKGIVDGETGLVFGNGDVDGLAAAVYRLARNPVLRAHLGEQARMAIKAANTANQTLNRLEGIYALVCGRAAHRSFRGRLATEAHLQGLMAASKDHISAASGAMKR